jgi:transcriptional regulator with XRE-family HTH domain
MTHSKRDYEFRFRKRMEEAAPAGAAVNLVHRKFAARTEEMAKIWPSEVLRLRRLMVEKGLSTRRVAEVAGLHRYWVGTYLVADTVPLENARKIRAAIESALPERARNFHNRASADSDLTELRLALFERNISQKKAAELIGVHVVTLARMLAGRERLRFTRLKLRAWLDSATTAAQTLSKKR